MYTTRKQGYERGDQMKLANRLNEFEAYLGTAMNLILTRMREEGKDVINPGLGNPDSVNLPYGDS